MREIKLAGAGWLLVLACLLGPGRAWGAPVADALSATGNASGGPLPGVAAALAFAPGVVVHGSGHFYAGRPFAGWCLVLAEAGSVYLAYRGVSELVAMKNELDSASFTSYSGDSERISRGIGWAAGGLVLFLASWFYDMSGAPLAAADANSIRISQSPESKDPSVVAQVQENGLRVGIQQKF